MENLRVVVSVVQWLRLQWHILLGAFVLGSVLAGCAVDSSDAAFTVEQHQAARRCVPNPGRLISSAEFATWFEDAYLDEIQTQGGDANAALGIAGGTAIQYAVAQTDLAGGTVQQRADRMHAFLKTIGDKFPKDWGITRFDIGRYHEIPMFIGTKGPQYPVLLVHPESGSIYRTSSALSADFLQLLPIRPPQAFPALVSQTGVFSLQAAGDGGTLLLVDFDNAYKYSLRQ